MFAVSLGQLYALACSLPEVIKFCPPGLSAANRSYIYDIWGMEGEDSFDSFIGDNPPDDESFVNASAFTRDYRSAEYLYARFVAFTDSAVDID